MAVKKQPLHSFSWLGFTLTHLSACWGSCAEQISTINIKMSVAFDFLIKNPRQASAGSEICSMQVEEFNDGGRWVTSFPCFLLLTPPNTVSQSLSLSFLIHVCVEWFWAVTNRQTVTDAGSRFIPLHNYSLTTNRGHTCKAHTGTHPSRILSPHAAINKTLCAYRMLTLKQSCIGMGIV